MAMLGDMSTWRLQLPPGWGAFGEPIHTPARLEHVAQDALEAEPISAFRSGRAARLLRGTRYARMMLFA